MNARFLVILIYFGEFPRTWPLTLETIRRNRAVDWLVITDQHVEASANVRVLHSTLDQMRLRFSSALGLDVALNHPYKLCDFRPAFGAIFEPEVGAYEYWGYCDADVVFGNLDEVLFRASEAGYDKIFQRGHLSLIRNIPAMNSLFRSTPESAARSEEVFANPQNFLFDEGGGFYDILANANVSVYEDNNIFDARPRRYLLTATTASRSARSIFLDGRDLWVDEPKGRHSGLTAVRYIHLQKRPYRLDLAAVDVKGDNQIVVFGPTSAGLAVRGQAVRAARRLKLEPRGLFRWVGWRVRRLRSRLKRKLIIRGAGAIQ